LCIQAGETVSWKTVSTSRTTNAVHTVQKFAELHTVQLTWHVICGLNSQDCFPKMASVCLQSGLQYLLKYNISHISELILFYFAVKISKQSPIFV